MKNPFASRSIKTAQSREVFFRRFETGVRNSSLVGRVVVRDDVARAHIRERGMGSFLRFTGVFSVHYVEGKEGASVSFRLRPAIYDAALFLVVVVLMIPRGEIPDSKWRVAADFHPAIMLVPVLAIIAVKAAGAFQVRDTMKQVLFHAAS